MWDLVKWKSTRVTQKMCVVLQTRSWTHLLRNHSWFWSVPGHRNPVHPMLEEHGRHCWLQQDGDTRRTSREAMHFLKKYYDSCLIYRGLWPPRLPDLISKGLWPPRSPGFSPIDFLWGHLKGPVQKSNPRTLEKLEQLRNPDCWHYRALLRALHWCRRGHVVKL